MRRRISHVWLVLLLLLPATLPGSAAWDQVRGSPERSGAWDPSTHDYDVLAFATHAAADTQALALSVARGPMAVHTGGRVVAVDADADSCNLRLASEATADWQRVALPDCQAGTLQAYLSQEQLVAVCREGEANQPLLIAYDLDGVPVWSARTEQGPTQTVRLLQDSLGTSPLAQWTCGGSAYDPARSILYTAFFPADISEPVGHAIAAIDATNGNTLWSTEITPAAVLPGSSGTGLSGGSGTGLDAHFYPLGITATQNGLVVTGTQDCPQCAGTSVQRQASVAWVSRDGQMRGILASHSTTNPERAESRLANPAVVSAFATGKLNVASLVLGNQVLLINPDASEPAVEADLRTLSSEVEAGPLPAGAWTSGRIVFGLGQGVSVYDENMDNLWSWSDVREWHVHDLLVSGGEVWLLLATEIRPEDAAPDESKIVRLDAERGNLLAEIRLPFYHANGETQGANCTPQCKDDTADRDPSRAQAAERSCHPACGGPNFWTGRFLPLPDGRLLVLDDNGDRALLGSAQHQGSTASADRSRAALRLSDAFPPQGATVTLTLGAQDPDDGGIWSRTVWWGDGHRSDATGADSVSHRYDVAGIHAIRVVTAYADGTTTTRTQAIHVGGEAPPDLNFMQRIFAPGNQDMAWGVIGLLIVLASAFVAWYRTRTRHGRLERELATIASLRREASTDIPGAIDGLEVYRIELKQKLGRGRLDDQQYSLLSDEAGQALSALRHRLLAPYEDRLTKRYKRLLEASLADGILNEAEADSLVRGLQAERKLRKDEREALSGFIETWARRQIHR